MANDRDADRPRGLGAPGWAGAVLLVLLGLLFLLQNLGLFSFSGFGNWWAFLMLLVGLFLAGTALTRYRAAGNRITSDVRGTLTAALFVSAAALIFIFGLDWSVWWPVFVILGGLTALLNWVTATRSGTDR